MALAETSRKVEHEKSNLNTNQQNCKQNGKGSSVRLNPWKSFFKKSTTSSTLRQNDDIARNENTMKYHCISYNAIIIFKFSMR